ncbi:AAA family ATPase [PVC group bacterium]|nr:AAA family ATPase [PVC group bacterium]
MSIKDKSLNRQLSTEDDRKKTIAYAQGLLDKQASSSETSKLQEGIAEIRSMVGEVLEHGSAGWLSPTLAKAQDWLVSQSIPGDDATEIVQCVGFDSNIDSQVLHQRLITEFSSRLPEIALPSHRNLGSRSVIALIGPTGVGKTTTIAKLATRFRLQQGRRVALITTDTYRIAAVDQLSKYAELVDASFFVASTKQQMRETIASIHSGVVVLIDTAGRSQKDGESIQETGEIVAEAKPTERHLVLSAATSLTATRRAAESFMALGCDRVIVTKLDEAVTLGEIVTTLCELKLPISWFTNGQDVSANLERAKIKRLVESFLPVGCLG